MTGEKLAPSAQQTLDNYSQAAIAERYRGRNKDKGRHGRESRAIARALEGIAAGAKVLDLPCGAARMAPMLLDMGYRVTAADGSAAMVDQARINCRELGVADRVEAFQVANIFSTGFADGEFDAVIVNRLFHHFAEPEARQAALKEVARISKDRVIASFFCTHSCDHWIHVVGNLLRGHASSRVVLPYRVFKRDVEAAGLQVKRIVPTRPGISRHWYLVLEHKR